MSNTATIIKELKLKPFGSKGWVRSEEVPCPICQRNDKFGINLKGKGGAHCFYCHKGFSLWYLLRKIGRVDLLSKDFTEIEDFKFLTDDMIKTNDKSDFKPLEVVKLPLGYKPLKKNDTYLVGRNFNEYHYELFKPGYSFLHPKLNKDYIIFLIHQHGKLCGWLARSRKDKKWHDKNLKDFKAGISELKLRYYNDSTSEFSKLLGGYDEITENTHTVIVVEGLFDKINVDSELGLHLSEEIKCVCTWGDGVTPYQAWLISLTNIDWGYLMYDFNTVEESKQAGSELVKVISNLKICHIKQKGIDPGELNGDEILDLISNSQDFLYFYSSRISVKFNK